MKYTKSLDHALMATYYANKAAKTRSVTAKRMFQKKALASILEAGKQSDVKYGMSVLEASLRLAAENEGIVPAEGADDIMVEDDTMPLEAEAEELPEEDEEDVVVEDEDDEEDDEDEESDDAELDAAFNRVMARARARRVKAAAVRKRPSKSRIR
jgi:hypothetical protein